MGVRKVAVSAGMAFALAAAFGLAGCGSGQHEVIDQGQDCYRRLHADSAF